ncbi:MAG: hypothetical protein ACXWFJ_07715 [Candidatus Aminicenantales bacterium]
MASLRRFTCIAMVVLLSSLTAAYAQTAALSDEQVKDRLVFITNALDAGQPRAGTWYYGWLAAYSTGAVAGGILAGSHWGDEKLEGPETVPDREFAEGMLVGGATFVLGVGGMLIDPFVPATAPRKLRRLPETTSVERLDKLRRAEELLRQCAQREKRGRNLQTHLLNAGVNAAAGIVTKLAFDQSWGSALITFATGQAVSLLNIFTQPMRATRDLKRYETGFAGDGMPPSLAPAERQWSLSIWPGGISFRLQF